VALLAAALGASALSLMAVHVATANSAAAGTGSDYHVAPAPQGSDSNDGSAAHPWATLQGAADHVANLGVPADGATVHVADGAYTGAVVNEASGHAGGYLTFVADHRWQAKLTSTADGVKYAFDNDADYVRISGFDITGSGDKLWTGILTWGQHNIIDHNHIHGISPACTGSPGGDGIGDDASASNNTFDSNVVNNIGPYPSECQYVHGIYPSGANDVIVNNLAYHNSGTGIRFNHNATGATIANNLSFANVEHGIFITGGDTTADGFVIDNNITRDNGDFGINIRSDANGSHNQYRDNLFYNNTKGRYGLDSSSEFTPPNTSGTLGTDPKLVNYQPDGTGDYHPTATSPCVDAGTSTGAPSTDYDGVSRPQGGTVDIGPYEYTTGTTSPSPSPSDSSSPSPGPSTVDFEDGTTDGWSGFYGNANASVVTGTAYDGTHALRFTLSGGGHAAVGTTRTLTALQPGSTITFHVWANQAGTTVRPFVRDTHYQATMAGTDTTLPAQQWVTLTWQVPQVTTIGAIGLDATPGTGTVLLDALTWPTT
jgi:hypothetical protein